MGQEGDLLASIGKPKASGIALKRKNRRKKEKTLDGIVSESIRPTTRKSVS